MTIKKIKYSEPAEYFPKEVRKKYRLGEYAERDTKKVDEDCGGLKPYNSIKPPKNIKKN